MKTIGFIGLGAMGRYMARNLVSAGYEVRGYDVRPEALAQLVADGGSAEVWIDGKPAEAVYRKLRGMKADEKLTSDWQHPVGVIIAPEKVYLRMILNWVGADGKDKDGKAAGAPPGSLRFVSPVVKGSKIKCLAGGDDARAIVASARRGVAGAVADAKAAGCTPALALVSNCCARGMRLRKFRKGGELTNPVHCMTQYYGEKILSTNQPLYVTMLQIHRFNCEANEEQERTLTVDLPFRCDPRGFFDPIKKDEDWLDLGIFPLVPDPDDPNVAPVANAPPPSTKLLHLVCEELVKAKVVQKTKAKS